MSGLLEEDMMIVDEAVYSIRLVPLLYRKTRIPLLTALQTKRCNYPKVKLQFLVDVGKVE
jgi:hypothetical protein